MTPKYRTIFFSDVHLGLDTPVELISDFLIDNDSQYIYLLGDIFDFWKFDRSFQWPRRYNEFLRVLTECGEESEMRYIPGNHDLTMTDFSGIDFGGITVCTQTTYTTLFGKKLLVCHGHEFDSVIKRNIQIAKLGCFFYDVLAKIDGWAEIVRGLFGNDRKWSLAAYLSEKVSNIFVNLDKFKKNAVEYSLLKGYDGIICGHAHFAKIDISDKYIYLNCGDIVDNQTILVEHLLGEFEIIKLS